MHMIQEKWSPGAFHLTNAPPRFHHKKFNLAVHPGPHNRPVLFIMWHRAKYLTIYHSTVSYRMSRYRCILKDNALLKEVDAPRNVEH
jgi:hypothetical protein